MPNPIYATWCISNNIGDSLTPWLIHKITGRVPLYVPFDVEFPKVMVSGSVLNHAVKYTTVWGAGIAYQTDIISKGITCLAVRGPMTARSVRIQTGIDVVTCGDPAWLMPRYFAPATSIIPLSLLTKYKVGICPHYLHQREVAAWVGNRNDIKILNVFDSPEQFVLGVLSCDVIYSSSLHGLVIADAYGVPSQWIECTDKLGGDGIKFYDHLIVRDCLLTKDMPVMDKLGLFVKYVEGQTESPKYNYPIKPIHLHQLPRDINALHEAIAYNPVPSSEARKALCDALMSVCPFTFRPEEPLKESTNENTKTNQKATKAKAFNSKPAKDKAKSIDSKPAEAKAVDSHNHNTGPSQEAPATAGRSKSPDTGNGNGRSDRQGESAGR